MSVQFKAYLYEGRPCRFKEVRRFSIDHDVSASYEYLRRKVAAVFPNIVDNFSLQWRDSDGDFIWFNSDEELIQALGQNSGNEFKLYIKEDSSDGNSQSLCGPRFRGCGPQFGDRQFNRCPPPFGFVHPEIFASFPFACQTEQKTDGQANKEKPSTPSQSKEQSHETYQNYLQEMGKAVAEFLQPFGVDVDIDVTDKKTQETTEASKPATEPTSTDGTDKPAAKPDESSSPDHSSPSQSTIINNEERPEDKERGAEVNLEVDEDAKLKEALDRLLSMGFNDHGAWLTNLLKASEYDIGRALEAMQPHRSRKN